MRNTIFLSVKLEWDNYICKYFWFPFTTYRPNELSPHCKSELSGSYRYTRIGSCNLIGLNKRAVVAIPMSLIIYVKESGWHLHCCTPQSGAEFALQTIFLQIFHLWSHFQYSSNKKIILTRVFIHKSNFCCLWQELLSHFRLHLWNCKLACT